LGRFEEGAVVAESPSRELERLVKDLLQDQEMSMRRLAAATGIDVAAISKMLSGKQRVNPEYLQRIAECLKVNPIVLFEAAGFQLERNMSAVEPNLTAICAGLFKDLGWNIQCTRLDIERELQKCEGYANTEEGQLLIVEKFVEKREQLNDSGVFSGVLDEMYAAFLISGISDIERQILGGALLYFIVATDAIPDYLFPVGYMDDAIALDISYKKWKEYQRRLSS
jgi:transcriptional regulator with XRE-family HTH domain